MAETKKHEPDANRDPLSGEPGSHPVGVGVGSTGGAMTGAAVGAVAGPVGIAVGAAVGGLVGGLAGKGMAEAINPSVEDAYWREHYASRPYVTPGAPYEAYRPAYRYGWEARGRYGELNWQAAEPHLRQEWIHHRNESSLDWDKASPATRDAWERIRPGVRYTEENR